ncbi:MAG TPA: electron transfer flavoprotein subunit alpha/FixB family protein [Candidatus Limnocylindrales bacterium]|nr:electron transfer flavoprotein subunit alpha/FixB family protein [Candidatus Limnocylindrales bacterium]
MAGPVWVHGELGPDGTLARIATETATAARDIADRAGTEAIGIVVAADPSGAAEELARFLPRVLAVTEPVSGARTAAAVAAERIAALARRDGIGYLVTGAGPEGRDVAGIAGALLDLPLLANAIALGSRGDGPTVDESAFGGKQLTTSSFTKSKGVITVRPNAVDAVPLDIPGRVEPADLDEPLALPVVTVVDRVSAEAAAQSIEEARVIVAGGRGVGGPDGFELLRELADALGGVVGATRAAVDAGWIPYAVQIGQTGKIVKPQLYLAMGISGAIQHKVGMQTAGAIVAVNRDPDAPIAEFADVLVVGDQAAVGRALLAALRDRSA